VKSRTRLFMAAALIAAQCGSKVSASPPDIGLPFMAGDVWWCSQGWNGSVSHGDENAWDYNYGFGASDLGFPLLAPDGGRIAFAGRSKKQDGTNSAYGNVVLIDYGDGYFGRLTHEERMVVKVGEQVLKGQVVGFCGTTGSTDNQWPSHIHYNTQRTSDPAAKDRTEVYVDFMDYRGQVVSDGYPIPCNCTSNPPASTYYTSLNSGVFDREFSAKGGSATFGSYLNESHTYKGIHWYYGWDNNDRYDDYGVPQRCYIQDFTGGSWGRCAIVYDGLGGARRAYTVRTGFWSNAAGTGWSQKGGPRSPVGMPITDEYSTGTGKARQEGIYGYLLYIKGASPDVDMKSYPVAAPGWAGRWDASFSYLFAMAYDRNGKSVSVGNATENVVLGWSGTQYHCQRFSGGTRGKGMLVYDPASSVDSWSAHPGNNLAYYLYGKFYTYWTTVSAVGPWILGAPTTDRSGSTQYFKYGRMVEVTLPNGYKVVKAYNRSGSLIWTSPQFSAKVVAENDGVEQDSEETAPLPATFTLSQNYPNPFNAETVIGYELLEAGQVRVDVFNILGQRVTSLVNDWQEAGKHTVSWAAYQQSSGIYFYRIQAGNRSEAKKMVLVK